MKPIGNVITTATLKGKNWRQKLAKLSVNTTRNHDNPSMRIIVQSGILPELTTKKVTDKHKEAKEIIEKKKNSNKKYYDIKKCAKAANIKN